jgi:hypothetical protein
VVGEVRKTLATDFHGFARIKNREGLRELRLRSRIIGLWVAEKFNSETQGLTPDCLSASGGTAEGRALPDFFRLGSNRALRLSGPRDIFFV